MKKRRQQDGMTLLEIAEAALHQVRAAPLEVLTPYYIGSLPFVLAFLYFWADMIQGAFAYRHVHTSALGVAAAFVWMKSWQAVSCAKMRANLAGGDTGAWGVARAVRLLATQSIIHATGFLALPVALLLMVPFGHVYAFYQNATVFGADEDNSVGAVARRAWTEARRWPMQNHQVIWLLSPLVLVLAAGTLLFIVLIVKEVTPGLDDTYLPMLLTMYVMLLVPVSPIGVLVAFNVGMAILTGPYLLQSLLGIDVAVSMGGRFVNSTFIAICVGAATLCIDPVMKAAYALRCFHGESLSTGEDLRVALRRAIASKGPWAGALIAAALVSFAAGPVHAQDAPARPAVQAGDLERAIAAELEKAEYVWRMPKEVPDDAFEDNFLTHFARAVLQTIVDGVKAVLDFLDWFFSLFRRGGWSGPSFGAGGGAGWMSTQRMLWYLVFGTLLAALAVAVYRIYRQRTLMPVAEAAAPMPLTPDLEDEDVSADALPEEGWLNLARDLIDRGDLRLAMRALFLASLAVLSHRDLVRVSKSKSNREYLRELERRAHAAPAVPPLFAAGMRAFERVWYGAHEADRAMFAEFVANQERVRALAKRH